MKKKLNIGVITMHRVLNYGSFLQAYSTQKIIEKLGHNCELIDYIFPNKFHCNDNYNIVNKIKYFIHYIIINYMNKIELTNNQKINNIFKKGINKYYNLSKLSYYSPQEIENNPPEYDLYVTGSDQTWNVKHTKGDPTFLLSFANDSKKKISFSSSIAKKSIENDYKEIFSIYLKKYNHISIRDYNGNSIIKELTGKNATITLDPTLLLSKKEWNNFGKKTPNMYSKQEYILLYMLSYAFEPRPYIYSILKKTQEKTGLKVYSFTKIPRKFGINYKYCGALKIENFVQIFESASYIITSSFHGTAFAVNFGIPLFSIVEDINSEDDRQISLLKQLNIENCIIPINTKYENINPKYDIHKEQCRLKKLRQESMNYLINSIK